LTTLLILLLYSVPFKEAFGCALLAFYPHIGALGKRHAVTKALDRLTVQVFHLEVCDWVWWWRWWRCCVCVWRFAGIMDSARPQLAQSAAG
jgi:hypothetical protein